MLYVNYLCTDIERSTNTSYFSYIARNESEATLQLLAEKGMYEINEMFINEISFDDNYSLEELNIFLDKYYNLRDRFNEEQIILHNEYLEFYTWLSEKIEVLKQSQI